MTPTLTAEEIRNARFSSSFRGYDSGEVRTFLSRVAASYAEVAGMLDGSQSRLTILAPPAAAPPVDDVVTQPLAEHHVFDDADPAGAGSDMPAGRDVRDGRDDRDADDVSVEAARDAAQIAVDAHLIEAQASETLAAARNEAHAIVAKANDEAARIILRARAESRGRPTGEGTALMEAAFAETPSDPALAKEQARLMISEAKAVRERILTDLAKRRKSAHIQLEQLRVAREKLLESLRDARRVVDEASRDLSTAEVEARLAAESAGRRVAAEPEPTAAELDIELTGAGHLTRSVPEFVGSSASDHETDNGIDSSTATIDGVVGGATATTNPPPTVASPPVGEQVTIDLRSDGAPATSAPAATSVWTGSFAGAASARADQAASEPAVDSELQDPVSAAMSDDEHREPKEHLPAPPGVDALFARLRAEREQASASARDVLGHTDSGGTAGPGEAGASKARRAKAPATKKDRSPSKADGAESSHQRGGLAVLDSPATIVLDLEAIAEEVEHGVLRDRLDRTVEEDELDERMLFVTGPLQSQLVRAVKRYLQDEQSTALAVLRTARGRVHLEMLIGDLTDHRRRVAEAVVPMFDDAFRAGLDPSSPQSDDLTRTQSGPYVHVVADEIITVVREEIGRGVAAASSPESDSGLLTEAISGCYRAWTTDRINTLSAEPLLGAFRAGRAT